MVKTTIDLDDDVWKKFSIKVIEDFGGRKKNDVIEGLVEMFLKDEKLSEALDIWLKKEKARSKEQ
jgi:hypothetical protein